jgi:uncharacterized protein (AIM24 family)
MTKVLGAGEKIVVDQDSVLAWASTVTLTFRRAGSCCTMCCGGEGTIKNASFYRHTFKDR